MYGFGSWLKEEAFPTLKDVGMLSADNMLSKFGGKDIIKDNIYNNEKFAKVSKVTSGLSEGAAKIMANLVAPGIGGQLIGGVQNTVGAMVPTDTSLQANPINIQQAQQTASTLTPQQQYSFKKGGMIYSYKNGGPINQRISEIKSGTTHEESEIGGVPIGQSALVEDGEFIFKNKSGNKYVFSNRY